MAAYNRFHEGYRQCRKEKTSAGLHSGKTNYRMRLDEREVRHSARIAAVVKSITTAVSVLGDVAVVKRASDDQGTG